MSSVSTVGESSQMLQYLQQLQTQATTLGNQISTGVKSTSFAGIAPQAAEVVNLNTANAQAQSYIDNMTTVTTSLKAQSQVMTSINSLVTQFQSTLSAAAQSNGANVQQTAQQLLSQVGGYLNTEGPSGYLFSGNQTSTPAFESSGLPTTASLGTAVDGAPPNGYYQGDNGVAQVTIANNVTVKYGVTANNSAFGQLVQVLNFYANQSTPPDPSNAADVANMNQAQTLLTNASTGIEQLVANNGEQQSQIANETSAQQNAMTLASTSLTGIEQVDSATAITQLNTLQTQLQASYQTINMLQSLSLVNYLK